MERLNFKRIIIFGYMWGFEEIRNDNELLGKL